MFMEKPPPEPRSRYHHFLTIPTRWMDNDVYGHVNNVIYYSYFDTVVNRYLIDQSVLDIESSSVIGLVVETQCRFFKPITFPHTVHAGLRVARLGDKSVRYEIGLYRNEEDLAARLRDTSSTSTWNARHVVQPHSRQRCEGQNEYSSDSYYSAFENEPSGMVNAAAR
jgi:acyl-CoA thioester hydrolase